MKQYYIYKTTNLINGKQYIGKHFGELSDDYLGSGILITKAIQKYGQDNFKKQILCICQNEEEANQKEQFYISKYNAVEDSNFYNIANGGQGGYVTKGYSLEQREEINQKISEKLSGENHPMYGKHWDEQHKEDFKQKSLQYWTEDKRQERSEKYQGENNPMYGKHHTEEAKKKMSEVQKIKFLETEEYQLLLEKLKNLPLEDSSTVSKRKTVKLKMYDFENNYIRTFNTKKQVLDFLNINNATHLNEAIKNHTLYKGFYWENDTV